MLGVAASVGRRSGRLGCGRVAGEHLPFTTSLPTVNGVNGVFAGGRVSQHDVVANLSGGMTVRRGQSKACVEARGTGRGVGRGRVHVNG